MTAPLSLIRFPPFRTLSKLQLSIAASSESVSLTVPVSWHLVRRSVADYHSERPCSGLFTGDVFHIGCMIFILTF